MNNTIAASARNGRPPIKTARAEGDLSPISAVVLVCKNHLVDEKDSFPVQAKWEMSVVSNDICAKSAVLKELFHFGKEKASQFNRSAR